MILLATLRRRIQALLFNLSVSITFCMLLVELMALAELDLLLVPCALWIASSISILQILRRRKNLFVLVSCRMALLFGSGT